MRKVAMLFVGMALGIAAPVAAESYEETPIGGAPDYSDGQNWLCLPGQEDACDVSLETTVVQPDGTMTVEENLAAIDPEFDCFYVYPTVSNDETTNSDMMANDEERRVILLQAAPFQQVCRMFAPLYRQVTLSELRRGMITGDPSGWATGREIAFADVTAAWEHYLANHNNGRGVVLIGHSQGASLLNRLLLEEIDGEPAFDRMIAAYLIGSTIATPATEQAIASNDHIPLCRSFDQIGCIVSFVSFRSGVPPPANTRFGRVEADGMIAACINPADPGGEPAPLDAWLSNRSLIADSEPHEWAVGGGLVTTEFVRVPGLLTAQCVAGDGANYLSVTVNADPADARTDTIPGDVVFNGITLNDWGLHLIDMNLAMGDMIGMVEQQATAWMAENASE